MRSHILGAVALVSLTIPSLAYAQASPGDAAAPRDGGVLDQDNITIGAGGTYGPSYRGSDDYKFSGIPAVRGRIGFVSFAPRPNGISFDFIPDAKGADIGFALGPVATYSRNRHGSGVKDDVVEAAGSLKAAIDVGVSGGVTLYHLTNPYDSLSLSADVKWNVNKAYRGMIVSPALTFTTPVSKAMLVSLGVGADHVDSDYAHYYFDVTPAQSFASGLPVYNARKGWADVSANLLVGYDLDGDLTNGGFAIFALGSYMKMLDDAKRTPYTSIRGDDNNFTVGLGVAYTFGL